MKLNLLPAKGLFVLLLTVFVCFEINAQFVRVNLNILPPYSNHLEDYLEFSDKTIVTLTNLSNETQQVKLLTSVTGDNGVSAVVKQTYIPTAPVVLNPMEVKILTGSQLQAINANLTENDVDVQGVPISRIIQTEVLPEGNYQVCIQAFDYQSNAQLSEPMLGCANIWITNYDPPEFILPTLDEQVSATTPQFVNFTWLPSGLAAFTRYKFEIVDMDLNNLQNINDAFGDIAVQLHFRQDNIITPNFQYQIGMPPLRVGHRYAIRVTAYDPLGRISFKNQGKSPVSAFYYIDPGTMGDEFGDDNGMQGPDDIVSEPPNNDPNQNDNEYADPCTPQACETGLANGNHDPKWKVGDEVQVGHFTLKLTAVVSVQNGIQGTGEVHAPMFNTWIKVNFDNLKINSDGVVAGFTKLKGDYDNDAQVPQKLKDIVSPLAGITGSEVKSVADYVQAAQKFTEALGMNPVKLPFAIKTNVGGQQQLINITAFEITQGGGAKINAFMHIDLPEANNQVLALGAKDICIHPTGLSEAGLQKLYLVEDFTYPFGPQMDFTLVADNGQNGGTFVRWDCEGYEEMQVEGEVEFSSEMLEPENGNGKVKAGFLVEAVETWGDLITTVDFDPFYVKGTKGLKFNLSEIILDFSDVHNAQNMQFPQGYQGDKTETWKGFYFEQLTITLPQYLKKNGNPIDLNMKDALIDKLGFSGKLSANNLIDIGNGSIGGWGFSLDELMIQFTNNSLTGSYFDGTVELPIAEFGLAYHCLLNNAGQELETEFQIASLDDLHVPMFVADFTLNNGSSLTISSQGNDVTAEADLSGGLTINGEFPDHPNLTVNLPDMSFEHLKVRNKKPYLTCEVFSMASPQKEFNGFNIQIDPEDGIKLTIDQNANTTKLDIGMEITLHTKNTGIAGSTNFSIIGKMTQNQGKQKWVYDKAQLNKISIYSELQVVTIDGEIEFFDGNDPTYGKGFRGSIKATFKPIAVIDATIQFGKVNGYKYWYVDAKAMLGVGGFPVGGGIAIYGFGGGAYYNMEPVALPPMGDINDIDGQNVANFNEFDLNQSGQSQSGVVYQPVQGGFGFMASITFGIMGDPTPFNADITIEASFNTNTGSLNYIGLSGDGYFMTGITERDNPKIYAGVSLQYWVQEKTFHGVFEIELNFNNILEGGGGIVVHAAPQEWYILAGQPNDRIDITIFNALTFKSYMMMGKPIPPPPSLPAEFQGKGDLVDFQLVRNLADELAGIAFGQQFSFDSDKLKFLIFYAHMKFTLGYDVALYKGIQCDEVQDPGINGWYGFGQAYASFFFKMGIEIDLWFLQADITVFQFDFYAAVQVGLVNPTWATGYVEGSYEALGGLLTGSFNFSFKAGKICLPPSASNPFGGLEVISDFSPTGELDDTFVTPEVAFALPLKTPIPVEIINEDNEKEYHSFRFFLKDIKVDRIGVKKNDKIEEITPENMPGEFEEINPKLAQFNADDPFKQFSKYQITARVRGERKIDGWWETVTENEGDQEPYYEVKHATFVTGQRPDKFLNKNIMVTYPRRFHRYFHFNDVNNGVINFKTDVSDIFKTKPKDPQAYKYDFVVKFHKIKTGANEVAEVKMEYDKAAKQVKFEIPDLQPNTIYMAQFVAKLVKNPSGWIVNNGPKLSTVEEVTDYGGGNTAVVKKTVINSAELEGTEHELYKLFFRTSKYGRWKDKWAKYTTDKQHNNPEPDFSRRIYIEKTGDEPLDHYDVSVEFYKKGSNPFPVEPLVGWYLPNLGSDVSQGNIGKIHVHYSKHLDWWLDNNSYAYIFETDGFFKRTTPGANDYGFNSLVHLNGINTPYNRDKTVGLEYIGNGKHGKLTMHEINQHYWQDLNQGPNNVPPQANNDIVLPPNQGHPHGGLPLQNNQGPPPGNGMQIGILDLQALNGGGGGNNGGGISPGGFGFNLSDKLDYRALITYDYVHVSYWDREKLKYWTSNKQYGGNCPTCWSARDNLIESCETTSFKLSASPNSKYYYNWKTVYPAGVSKSGSSIYHTKETMFKYPTN